MTGIVLRRESTPNRLAEAAADRADELLRIWQLPPGVSAEEVQGLRSAAAGALTSGEARQLAEAVMAPVPGRDLAMILGELVASWPPKQGQDLSIFSQNMAQDVARAAPGRAALLLACRALRASHTFLPSIAEVLEAVEVSKAACAARAGLLERLPRRIMEIDRQK